MITCHSRPVMVLLALSILVLSSSCRVHQQPNRLSLYELSTRQAISSVQAIDALQSARLVIVGEHHTDPAHHAAQLDVIRFLDEQAVPLSIGLEMFRKDQQGALDRWVAGDIDEEEFKAIYLENWRFPWHLYREIFNYARKKRIPMVGLNVSRGLTQQVAQHGFASLSDTQRGALEGVTCNVTREYRDFIRGAFGAHGHGKMDFNHFCEAQLVWDTAMAINALGHLEGHPDQTMVLLAGSGHARKMGIPHQIMDRSPIPFVVLLPHTPDIFEPASLTTADADFIIMP